MIAVNHWNSLMDEGCWVEVHHEHWLCGGGMEWSIKCGEFIAWYIPIILWFSVKPIFQKVGLMWAHEKMQAPWSFQLSENCQSVPNRIRKREKLLLALHWKHFKLWCKKPAKKPSNTVYFLCQLSELNTCSVFYSDKPKYVPSILCERKPVYPCC